MDPSTRPASRTAPATAAPGRPGARARAYGQLALSMALVGTYVALSKPLTASIPIFVLAFLRFAIAAIVMLPWTLPARHEGVPSRSDRRLLFVQSLFGNFLFTLCMLSGVALTSATSAGVVLAALPAVVLIGARLALGEHLHAFAIAGTVLVTVGIALLRINPGADTSPGSWSGDLLVFGAVCCEATYVIIGKRLAARIDPMRISAWLNLCGLVLVAPFGLSQWHVFEPAKLDASSWCLLVYYSLAASLFSVWLWMRGLAHVPAHHAAVFTAALPLSATAVGALFLGETLTPARAVAVGLSVAGIVLVSGAGTRRADPV